MKSWEDSLCKLLQREKEALIIQLVDSLQAEDGYYHMTVEQVFKEQCALIGLETED